MFQRRFSTTTQESIDNYLNAHWYRGLVRQGGSLSFLAFHPFPNLVLGMSWAALFKKNIDLFWVLGGPMDRDVVIAWFFQICCNGGVFLFLDKLLLLGLGTATCTGPDPTASSSAPSTCSTATTMMIFENKIDATGGLTHSFILSLRIGGHHWLQGSFWSAVTRLWATPSGTVPFGLMSWLVQMLYPSLVKHGECWEEIPCFLLEVSRENHPMVDFPARHVWLLEGIHLVTFDRSSSITSARFVFSCSPVWCLHGIPMGLCRRRLITGFRTIHIYGFRTVAPEKWVARAILPPARQIISWLLLGTSLM